jgi:hypothetical protein
MVAVLDSCFSEQQKREVVVVHGSKAGDADGALTDDSEKYWPNIR